MQHGIKKYKTGDYYSVQAVSMFTTNQFILLCPKDIIKFYRESWKFELLNVDFDINTGRNSGKKLHIAYQFLQYL